MKVFETLNRGPTDTQIGQARHGGAHVSVEVSDGAGWPRGEK